MLYVWHGKIHITTDQSCVTKLEPNKTYEFDDKIYFDTLIVYKYYGCHNFHESESKENNIPWSNHEILYLFEQFSCFKMVRLNILQWF